MADHLLIFIAVFVNAIFHTFNNLHIMRLREETAIPCSLLTSFVNVCVIASVVEHGYLMFIPVGLGYGFGQIVAMRIFRHRERGDDQL